MRSTASPHGFLRCGRRPRRVVEANTLATRSARFARAQVRAGQYFSIENPENSFLWLLPSYVQLQRLSGVFLMKGDQCPFGQFSEDEQAKVAPVIIELREELDDTKRA